MRARQATSCQLSKLTWQLHLVQACSNPTTTRHTADTWNKSEVARKYWATLQHPSFLPLPFTRQLKDTSQRHSLPPQLVLSTWQAAGSNVLHVWRGAQQSGAEGCMGAVQRAQAGCSVRRQASGSPAVPARSATDTCRSTSSHGACCRRPAHPAPHSERATLVWEARPELRLQPAREGKQRHGVASRKRGGGRIEAPPQATAARTTRKTISGRSTRS